VLPVLGAVLWLGNDGSFDLRNYHLYNPHAWLHGRYAGDIAAAQMQGYHNPLLDLPLYLLASAGAPAKLIGLWLALPAMLSIACLLRLQSRLSPRTPSTGEMVLLALLALTGAASWSTLGLSMNDAFVGAGMLVAIVLLVDGDALPGARRCLLAGAVAGATIGLKLSAGFYAPALALALHCVPGTVRERLVRVSMLGLGGLLGIAITYGWWGWSLWQAHGNPFFPYFNDVFRSPEVAARSWVDGRFLPASLADIGLAPLRLLARTRLYSEAGIKDPRLLVGLLGFAWLAWRSRSAPPTRRGAMALLAVFVFVALLGWGRQSGIYRYAIVLELLGCLALALLLAQRARVGAIVLLAVAVLVSADTSRPDWGRIASTRSPAPVLAVGQSLPKDALVVTASGAPTGYLALALPDGVPMLGLSNNLIDATQDGGLEREVARRVRAHRGPIYLATTSDPGAQQCLTDRYALVPDGACLRIQATPGNGLLCPQRRMPTSPRPPGRPRCSRE
jgi:hypothetical protein